MATGVGEGDGDGPGVGVGVGEGVGVGVGREPGVPPLGVPPEGRSELVPFELLELLPLSTGGCGAHADNAIKSATKKIRVCVLT